MSTPKPQTEAFDPDSLADLEQRVLQTVELVSLLRAERDSAVAERDHALTRLKAARAEIEGLSAFKKAEDDARVLRQEISELRAERKQVRQRIEKLLAQIDLVSGQ